MWFILVRITGASVDKLRVLLHGSKPRTKKDDFDLIVGRVDHEEQQQVSAYPRQAYGLSLLQHVEYSECVLRSDCQLLADLCQASMHTHPWCHYPVTCFHCRTSLLPCSSVLQRMAAAAHAGFLRRRSWQQRRGEQSSGQQQQQSWKPTCRKFQLFSMV